MTLGVQTPAETDQATYQLQAIERVLNVIAHDLKNPLSIVRGNAQLAVMVNKDEKVDTCLRRIINAVDSATEILNEVRCLRQPSSAALEPFDLADVLQEACQSVEDHARTCNVVCVWPEPLHITIIGYKLLLTKALRHLLRNAVEAMPNGGTLKVAEEVHTDSVNLVISDTGSGIPSEEQHKVFREFFSTKTGGCGWGLIIVDQVVRVGHKGQAAFTSSNAGTIFKLTLPR